jgi:hypothetical protein
MYSYGVSSSVLSSKEKGIRNTDIKKLRAMMRPRRVGTGCVLYICTVHATGWRFKEVNVGELEQFVYIGNR